MWKIISQHVEREGVKTQLVLRQWYMTRGTLTCPIILVNTVIQDRQWGQVICNVAFKDKSLVRCLSKRMSRGEVIKSPRRRFLKTHLVKATIFHEMFNAYFE